MAGRGVTVGFAHGAWADGSSWSKVIGLLAARGIKSVAAPPLPLTSLADDVAALDRTLESVGAPVVLVGHAYAGAVVAATRNEQVHALVYVGALAPAEGETVADVFYRAESHPDAPALAPDPHGLIWLPDHAFATAFAQHASADEATWLAAVQRPVSVACIGTKAARPLWMDRPNWYLVAEEDRMINPDTQRFMAARMKAKVVSHPFDHAPSVTAPQAVADLEAERSVAGNCVRGRV